MRGLDHIKRMSKKVDVDRAWSEYYRGRPTRGMKGASNRGRVGNYHYTKGYRKGV